MSSEIETKYSLSDILKALTGNDSIDTSSITNITPEKTVEAINDTNPSVKDINDLIDNQTEIIVNRINKFDKKIFKLLTKKSDKKPNLIFDTELSSKMNDYSSGVVLNNKNAKTAKTLRTDQTPNDNRNEGGDGLFDSLLGGGIAALGTSLFRGDKAKALEPMIKTSGSGLATTSNVASKGTLLSKIGGKASIGGLIGGIALDYAADKLKESGHEKLGATASIGSSTLSGASLGAMFGSVVPVVGTAIGGAVGGALGAGYGLYQNWDAFSNDKPEDKNPDLKKNIEVIDKTTDLKKNIEVIDKTTDLKKNIEVIDKTTDLKKNIELIELNTNLTLKKVNSIYNLIDKKNPKIKFKGNHSSVPTMNNKRNSLTPNIQNKETGIFSTIGNTLSSTGESISNTISGALSSAYDSVSNFFGFGAETGNVTEARDFFISKGWTKEQASGIVGNLIVESKLKTNALGDSGKAYGIAQWHPDRQANFRKVFNKDIRASTFKEQLAFVDYELRTGSERQAGNIIKNQKTASGAAAAVDEYYERSSGQHRQERIRQAMGTMNYVAPDTASSTANYANIPTGNKNALLLTSSAATGGFDNLHPAYKPRLIGLGEDFYKATGKKMNVYSAYRSITQQAALYEKDKREHGGKSSKMVAEPGKSQHNFGLAADIEKTDVNKAKSLGLLNKWGLHTPMSKEPWHVEPIEVRDSNKPKYANFQSQNSAKINTKADAKINTKAIVTNSHKSNNINKQNSKYNKIQPQNFAKINTRAIATISSNPINVVKQYSELDNTIQKNQAPIIINNNKHNNTNSNPSRSSVIAGLSLETMNPYYHALLTV